MSGLARRCNSLSTIRITGGQPHVEECASRTMISWRRQSERITAAATALLFQVALYLAMSQREPSLISGTNAPSLVARIVAATRPKPEAPSPVRASDRLIPIPLTEQPSVRPVIPLVPQSLPSRPAFDWQGGIQDEVRAELARAHARPKLRFDFPKMPAPEAPAPEFGWDDKHLNRIQRLAHGIIDFGDHCFILLWPPIPQCPSEPANGELFKNMHRDERLPGPNTLP